MMNNCVFIIIDVMNFEKTPKLMK